MEEEQKILVPEEKQTLLEIYKIAEDRRMHYDTLAWAIGAILVPLAIYIYRFALVELRSKVEYIVPVGMIGIVLFLFWHICYDRLGKCASLSIDSINEIEKALQLQVKPHHHFHRNISAMGSPAKFKGFGDYFSFWSLRWMLFSFYSFIWIILWAIILKGASFDIWSLFYLLVPVAVLFYLNLVSLMKMTFFHLNARLVSIAYTVFWFFAGLAFFMLDLPRSIPSIFVLLITR